MQVKVTRRENYFILSYEGDTVDLHPGPLKEVHDAIREGAVDIILDFMGVDFLSSTGVKCLEETLDLAKKHGAHVGITSPTRQVRRMLKLTGLSREIPVYFNLPEAMSKLDMIEYTPEIKQEAVDNLLICQHDLPVAGELRSAIREHPLNPGFRMKPVRDFREAMEILRKERIDCILVDSNFPMYKVAAFIEELRTDDKIPHIPILIVTKDEKLDEAEMMIRHGANELIRFPFNPTEAVVRVQTLISHIKDHRPYYPAGAVVQPRGYKA
jgi:anti-anti-sigma factor